MAPTEPVPTPVVVRCPYCLEDLRFDPGRLLLPLPDGAGYQPFDARQERSPVRRHDLVRSAFQLCPNTEGLGEHLIPVPYLNSGTPLTIAMIGDSTAGKTHLLAAMLGEVERGGLDDFGLSVRSVNGQWHERFVRDVVQPLHAGRMLEHTRIAGDQVRFVDALLVTGHGWTRPVAFYDLAGEDLMRTDHATRFLAGADALIFVVDPVTALPSARLDPIRIRLGISDVWLGDRTFGSVLDRIERRTGRLIDVPAAVAISKCDLLRYEPPVDRWLGEPVRPPLDPQAIEEESRDAFAFLDAAGGRSWLRPYVDCRRCTVHFTSATGGEARDGRFPAGARNRRALQPLLSVLAMCGLLGPDAARAVGW